MVLEKPKIGPTMEAISSKNCFVHENEKVHLVTVNVFLASYFMARDIYSIMISLIKFIILLSLPKDERQTS